MKERLISFNDQMITAISSGKKTQTRRLVTPHPPSFSRWHSGEIDENGDFLFSFVVTKGTAESCSEVTEYIKSPYGKTGDQLLVKNTDIILEITKVGVEKIQDITGEDVLAEGVVCDVPHTVYRDHFIDLWDSIYGQGAWGRNDWVWVYEFKKL